MPRVNSALDARRGRRRCVLESSTRVEELSRRRFLESILVGLTALQGARDYKVSAHAVYALPNNVAKKPMNAAELRGNVALCHRGETPIVQKILALQDSGAVGAILVDDGGCEDDLDCRGRRALLDARRGCIVVPQAAAWARGGTGASRRATTPRPGARCASPRS